MSRTLAADFGLARVGLAISDKRQVIGFPYKTLHVGNLQISEIAKKIYEEIHSLGDISQVVLGWPLNLNGTEGQACVQVRILQGLLQGFDLDVQLYDERFSSLQVEKTMKNVGYSRKKRAQKVDVLSAVLILQSYLDSKVLSGELVF